MTDSPHLPAVVHTHAVPSSLAKRPEVPALLRDAGDAAAFAWDEFFSGTIRNKHTRKAYRKAVTRFLAWLEPTGVPLVRVTPGLVGEYLDTLPLSATSKKVELAALRRFFDLLTVRHVLVLNPALSVRGERVSAVEGLTPRIPPADARALLQAIDPSTVVGLRDRAVLACLVFTAARVGAVAKLTRGSLRADGTHYRLRFQEKGGKVRDIPARAELEEYLLAYLAAAGLTDAAANTPLFRTADGKSGRLTAKGMTGGDMWRLMKRRLLAAGLYTHFSPHSFRATVATNLLEQDVKLEDVQFLLGHADPRTTRLYDRRQRAVTRNIVERIGV
jgi:site-specific recombinase XerD